VHRPLNVWTSAAKTPTRRERQVKECGERDDGFSEETKKESPANPSLLVAEGADGLDAGGAVRGHGGGENADGDEKSGDSGEG
jgi:hypothetical protein